MAMPISLAYLIGNLDKTKYAVDVIDCVLDEYDTKKIIRRILHFKPDVVGFSSWSVNFPESLETVKAVKKAMPQTPIIMGGPHATCYPDSVLRHPEIDFIFRGEAELAFPVFLEELNEKNPKWSKVPGLIYRTKGGRVRKNPHSLIQDLDEIKYPDYDAIRLEDYLKKGYRLISSYKRNVPIITTRGCPYGCAYCSASIINGRVIRRHSLPYLIRFIHTLYDDKGIRSFSILDDNFTFDTTYAKDFCRSIIRLGLKKVEFCTTNGIRMQRGDKELWYLMKRAGWRIVIVAPESGSTRVLRLMRKGLSPRIVPKIVSQIKESGLRVTANFIIGFPGETPHDVDKTFALIKKANIDFANIHFFQPLPGTPIYDELVLRKEIPEDFIPGNYEKGNTPYITGSLNGFNFSRFYYKVVIYTLLRNPSYIYYFLKSYRLASMFPRLVTEFMHMFTPITKKSTASI
jgi:anaerobic magnesium-protoporphyrin IX monomethyl ester cyclase